MELTEHYQPEFVSRFDARETACECPACRNGGEGWPHISVKMKNQQRESLDIVCETAAKEMLFNPDAFYFAHHAEGSAGRRDALSMERDPQSAVR